MERQRKLLEEKDTLIMQWRQEAHAAQEAADAALHAVRESEELAIQACPPQTHLCPAPYKPNHGRTAPKLLRRACTALC